MEHKNVGGFNYEGKPLLEAALRLDDRYRHKFEVYGVDYATGEPVDESYFEKRIQDTRESLVLFERHLAEEQPDRYDRADLLAYMGGIALHFLQDRERAIGYYEEAFDLVGFEIITDNLFLARTNYLSITPDHERRFTMKRDFIAWMQEMDVESIRESMALRWNTDLEIDPYRTIMNSETGETIEIRIPDDILQSVQPKYLRQAEQLRTKMDDYLRTRGYEVADAALKSGEPVKAINELIELTENTPMEESVQRVKPQAERIQDILENALDVI
jgi:tetratricopeptide (TPR) repeat protein